MNRVQFWLLLLLGVILFGAAAFWLFGRPPAPALTDAAATPVAGSPVQITDIIRRRPNMLVVEGKAAPATQLTLRLAGNKVGQATADATGTFQLTTNPLPQGESLDFTLQYGVNDGSVFLNVIDRHPQPIALLGLNGRYVPLQRLKNGSAILLAEWPKSLNGPTSVMHLAGQAPGGSMIFAYAGNILVGKTETPNGDGSQLFNIELDDRKFSASNKGPASLRFDIYDRAGTIVARLEPDFTNEKSWQKLPTHEPDQFNYLWRDLETQQANVSATIPGQFIPVAGAPVATAQ